MIGLYKWIFWYDWLLLPIYFLILTKLFFAYGRKNYSGKILQYFKYGFLGKMFGAFVFAIYHQYIFKGGDTYLYFSAGISVSDFITTDFSRYLTSVFAYSDTNLDLRFDTIDSIVFNPANFFVARVTAVLALISFKAYFPILLFFAALSYIGVWYAYSSLIKLYKNIDKELAIVFLFIPSIVLWGSGLGKDSLTLGGTCLIFGALLRLFLLKGENKIKNIIFLMVGFYVVVMIKSYIVYSFLLSFIFGIAFQKIPLIKNQTIKIIITPLIFIVVLICSYLAFSYISNDPDFGLDLIADNVIRNNRNLSNADAAGSSYDLGIDINSVNGFTDIIPIFPKSVFITLFRPFLWEVSNPAMLLSAMESLMFFSIFLYAILKNKIFGIFSVFIKNPLAISCLFYTILFAGLIGISSGNFGTLVRYKIPCLPFFGLLLVLILRKKQQKL